MTELDKSIVGRCQEIIEVLEDIRTILDEANEQTLKGQRSRCLRGYAENAVRDLVEERSK